MDLPGSNFSEMEKLEYFRAIKMLRQVFRNGPIYGDAIVLLIKEIEDKRNIKKPGYRPHEKDQK